MHSLPYLSNIITVKQTQGCWWQLNNVGCRTFTGTRMFKSPTGLLTKARQQFIWSYLVRFLPWSKIIIWIQPRTGPQLSGKRPQRRKSGWLFGPPSCSFCVLELEKQDGKYRLQRVKGLGKSWCRVARYTSKVTGLRMARAPHWRSIHGTKYLECLAVSFPQRLEYLYAIINRSVR